ncbi:GRAM domain family protein [Tasmannia lanceolata]|uniref:GRAM domain family protein n=1 Tax=Tasmannia lanceolata TaxID=3420 RepID=UPI00406411E3
MNNKAEEQQSHQPPSYPTSAEIWGTTVMGSPAVPSAHPQNQQAALWNASELPHPYILHQSPVDKPSGSPMESILDYFNSWTKKAEEMATNIWVNLKMAPSPSEAAMGKLRLTAKALKEGGFESLYKQTFPMAPDEKLKKTFACYLSTTTGPVAGTLYLSNVNVAFCSDRPLSFIAPSGQKTWNYYKILVPLSKIPAVNPITMRENPKEKYIEIVTKDGHEFWFMGFVNYEKADTHLSQALAESAASQKEAESIPG